MKHPVSPSLQWAYVIVVLAAVIPFGLSGSGWVGLATGGGVPGGIPVVGPLVLLVVGVYRAYTVVKVPGTLESCPVGGFALALRKIGVVGLYAGAVIGVLNLIGGPLMRGLMARRTESGAEFFVAGLVLAMAGGVGVLSLLLFELSRLVGFEQHRQSQPELPDTVIQR